METITAEIVFTPAGLKTGRDLSECLPWQTTEDGYNGFKCRKGSVIVYVYPAEQDTPLAGWCWSANDVVRIARRVGRQTPCSLEDAKAKAGAYLYIVGRSDFNGTLEMAGIEKVPAVPAARSGRTLTVSDIAAKLRLARSADGDVILGRIQKLLEEPDALNADLVERLREEQRARQDTAARLEKALHEINRLDVKMRTAAWQIGEQELELVRLRRKIKK